MDSILTQFLREEVTWHALQSVLASVAEHEINSALELKTIDFNRFFLTIDFFTDSVLIEDDLDPSSSGKQRVALGEFIQCLTRGGTDIDDE